MRKRWMALTGFVMVAVSVGAYAKILPLTGNIHEVLPGELYRSAQLGSVQILTLQKKDGIRSILNLRGAYPGAPWYDAEIRQSQALGITHADFAMSSSHELSVEQSEQLVALMRSLPKPLLIHCEHGADRTGLASALYVGVIKGQGEEEAEDQLSLAYGHFSVPYLSAAYPMDESWERMEPVLGIKS